MAIAMLQEFPIQDDDRSTANYDGVNERLGADTDPPTGLIAHSAGFDEEAGVFRIFDIWASEADWKRFESGRLAAAVQPLIDAGALPPAKQYTYDLHNVING
jgi:hypothetical protein